METVNKNFELGGNIKLYVIPNNLVKPITGLNIEALGPDPTCKLNCGNETIRHICKPQPTRAGLVYEHTVTAFVQGRNEATERILERLMYFRHIVILADSTGAYWRIGDSTEGLTLLSDFDSSDNPSSKNGYSITLSGILTSPARKTNFPLI